MKGVLVLTCVATLGASEGCASRVYTAPDLSFSKPGAKSTREITIRRPTVIGFYPSSWEGLEEHFSYAMMDTYGCLKGRGVEVRLEGAETLILKNGSEEDVLQITRNQEETFGCYLVWPGRKAQVISAPEHSASSLIFLCPIAARNYFGIMECCPKDMTCCPNGDFSFFEDGLCVMELP